MKIFPFSTFNTIYISKIAPVLSMIHFSNKILSSYASSLMRTSITYEGPHQLYPL